MILAHEDRFMSNNKRTEMLISLESARCRHIVMQEFDALRELLSSELIHTHTRGNQDTRDSYLEYLRKVVEILDLRREDLHVQWVGDKAAVMHGKQFNRARLRGHTDEVHVEAQVIQVWALESDGNWRQLAFQATALGPLPPAVRR